MMFGLAAFRKAAQASLIEKEACRIQESLASIPNKKERCGIKTARRILLKGDYIYDGKHCSPKSKHIGCGVYEITLTKDGDEE